MSCVSAVNNVGVVDPLVPLTFNAVATPDLHVEVICFNSLVRRVLADAGHVGEHRNSVCDRFAHALDELIDATSDLERGAVSVTVCRLACVCRAFDNAAVELQSVHLSLACDAHLVCADVNFAMGFRGRAAKSLEKHCKLLMRVIRDRALQRREAVQDGGETVSSSQNNAARLFHASGIRAPLHARAEKETALMAIVRAETQRRSLLNEASALYERAGRIDDAARLQNKLADQIAMLMGKYTYTQRGVEARRKHRECARGLLRRASAQQRAERVHEQTERVSTRRRVCNDRYESSDSETDEDGSVQG